MDEINGQLLKDQHKDKQQQKQQQQQNHQRGGSSDSKSGDSSYLAAKMLNTALKAQVEGHKGQNTTHQQSTSYHTSPVPNTNFCVINTAYSGAAAAQTKRTSQT